MTTLTPLSGIGEVQPGEDLGTTLCKAITRLVSPLRRHDVLVVAQKIVSKAEGRYVDLGTVQVSRRAAELGAATRKDPRVVELVLAESTEVLRAEPDAPIIAGEAVKGPTAKIMRELGVIPSALEVIEHYRLVIDAMVLDERDAGLVGQAACPVRICDTLMSSLEDRERVAHCALELAAELS